MEPAAPSGSIVIFFSQPNAPRNNVRSLVDVQKGCDQLVVQFIELGVGHDEGRSRVCEVADGRHLRGANGDYAPAG